MDSFRPFIEMSRRKDDDMKMFLLRIISAVSLIYLFYQFAQEQENIDSLTSFSKEGFNDLFEWGNQRFVMGRLADNKNGTKRKLTPHEIFMNAILEEEEAPKAENTDEGGQPLDQTTEGE